MFICFMIMPPSVYISHLHASCASFRYIFFKILNFYGDEEGGKGKKEMRNGIYQRQGKQQDRIQVAGPDRLLSPVFPLLLLFVAA